jgi:hypothetical protein
MLIRTRSPFGQKRSSCFSLSHFPIPLVPGATHSKVNHTECRQVCVTTLSEQPHLPLCLTRTAQRPFGVRASLGPGQPRKEHTDTAGYSTGGTQSHDMTLMLAKQERP